MRGTLFTTTGAACALLLLALLVLVALALVAAGALGPAARGASLGAALWAARARAPPGAEVCGVVQPGGALVVTAAGAEPAALGAAAGFHTHPLPPGAPGDTPAVRAFLRLAPPSAADVDAVLRPRQELVASEDGVWDLQAAEPPARARERLMFAAHVGLLNAGWLLLPPEAQVAEKFCAFARDPHAFAERLRPLLAADPALHARLDAALARAGARADGGAAPEAPSFAEYLAWAEARPAPAFELTLRAYEPAQP